MNNSDLAKKVNLLKNVVIVLSVVVILLLALLMVLVIGSVDSNDAQNENTMQPTEDEQSVGETTHTFEDIPVQTPYCTLYYQGEWADDMEVVYHEDPYSCAVEFYYNQDDKLIHLYTVFFADASENSFPVGIYESADGVLVDVSVELSDLLLDDSLSQEEENRIYSMQESVNYLLEKLSEETSFIAI